MRFLHINAACMRSLKDVYNQLMNIFNIVDMERQKLPLPMERRGSPSTPRIRGPTPLPVSTERKSTKRTC